MWLIFPMFWHLSGRARDHPPVDLPTSAARMRVFRGLSVKIRRYIRILSRFFEVFRPPAATVRSRIPPGQTVFWRCL